PFATVPQALRQREFDFRSSAMIDVGTASANATVSIWFGYLGYGALALAFGALAQQAARAAIAQWRVGGKLPWPLHLTDMRRFLSFGGTNSILVTCALLASKAPEIVIGRAIGPAAVGLFTR